MTTHEMEQVLAVVKHYMDMDLRRKVMTEAPAAYNAWMGRDVVEVRRTSDGRKLGYLRSDRFYVSPGTSMTGEDGWRVYAPSGAWLTWHPTRAQADAEREREQAGWLS